MTRVVLATGVWVVLVALLWSADASPAVAVLGGVVAVAATAITTVVDLTRDAAPRWEPAVELPAARPERDPRVSHLHRDVSGAESAESTALHDSIVELVDDRLLTAHGIDRDVDGAAAEAVLGPALRRFVDGPHRSDTSPRHLARVLSELEEL